MKKISVIVAVLFVSLSAFTFVYNNGNSNQITQKSGKVGLEVGDEAPELKFKNPEGKDIALSSLRGNVVLIDFWASWCRPCRVENPNVVRAYNAFKDAKFKSAKGFTIYNVSLDQSKDAWMEAIKRDGLVWDHHVSDLMGWNSMAARTYGINSIPYNLLIDANGVILAKNLRGNNLELELQKLVK